MTARYNVYRYSQRGGRRLMKRDLTLAAARRLCSDPETSSQTAHKPVGCAGDEQQIARWHEQQKHWFDGYEEQR